MNINEGILQGILADNGIYASEQEAVFKAIEIKPVDCDECKNSASNNGGYEPCSACSRFYSDCFEPKHNELDSLFVGAPVIIGSDMITTPYYKETKRAFRLPTVKESPRNVWLAPPLEMPDLIDHKVLLWAKDGEIMCCPEDYWPPTSVNWDNVKAIMILKELEK